MKLRDHIADLISGGAMTRALEAAARAERVMLYESERLHQTKKTLGSEIQDLCRKLKAAENAKNNALDDAWRLTCVLGEIHDHCAKLKSGTAKRITRICKEALDE